MSIAIIYDGECPVCSRYVRYLRLRDAGGGLEMIDARRGGPEVAAARARGLVLDEGFVLRVGDQYFHGADAMNRLALMSTPVGAFNRLNHALFRNPRASRLSYPVLRTGRNLLLRLLGRSRLGY
jgi:predicted DCC family thiol-disulfide oxidoreductase YuxK